MVANPSKPGHGFSQGWKHLVGNSRGLANDARQQISSSILFSTENTHINPVPAVRASFSLSFSLPQKEIMKVHALAFLSAIQLCLVFANELNVRHTHLKRQGASRAIISWVYISNALPPPFTFVSFPRP